jgi:hypothetical protein
MTETPQPQITIITRLWSVWLGLLIFALMSFVALYSAAAFSLQNLLIGAVILAALTGGAAIAAWRFGRLGLAAGLILGYVLMSLVTSGTCTLLARDENYNALGGLFYGMGLIGSLVILIIVFMVDRFMNRRPSS